MQEVGERAGSGVVREKEAAKKPSKKDPLSNVTPIGTYKEEKKSFMPVIYVILGAILGLAISFVLLRPTLLKSSGEDGSQISDANDQLAVQSSQISSLQTEKETLEAEVKDLQQQITDADTEAQQKVESYEKLLSGVKAYIENDKIQAAIEVADCKKSDFDSSTAKKLYTTIGAVTDTQIASLLAEGKQTMYSSYDGAIATFKKVLALDEDNQDAMYQMAYCYQKKGSNKTAKTWYEKAIQVDDTSALAATAETHLSEVEAALGQTN
jgi:tetratricopeptide (TPR) repeat protein